MAGGGRHPRVQASLDLESRPEAPRKLLVHQRQLLKLTGRVQEKGLTLVPLSLYFNARGIVKICVGVCRGKKMHDKRQTLKDADARRQISRAIRK